MFFKNQGQNQF